MSLSSSQQIEYELYHPPSENYLQYSNLTKSTEESAALMAS